MPGTWMHNYNNQPIKDDEQIRARRNVHNRPGKEMMMWWIPRAMTQSLNLSCWSRDHHSIWWVRVLLFPLSKRHQLIWPKPDSCIISQELRDSWTTIPRIYKSLMKPSARLPQHFAFIYVFLASWYSCSNTSQKLLQVHLLSPRIQSSLFPRNLLFSNPCVNITDRR